MLRRSLAVTLGCTLGLAGLIVGLAVVFAPTVEVNPFQASPESPTVNLVTSLVLFFTGLLLTLRGTRAPASASA